MEREILEIGGGGNLDKICEKIEGLRRQGMRVSLRFIVVRSYKDNKTTSDPFIG